jgi:hypothetical protein
MTMRAELPDGRILEFPDGTKPEIIQQTVKRTLGVGQPAASPALDVASTGLGGLIEGVPIVGPYIRSGIEKAAAATHAAFSDKTYQENLDFIRSENKRMKEDRPILDKSSQVAGAVGGTLLGARALGAVAPTVAPLAFGAGPASLPLRMAASGATGAAMGGADAFVRSDYDGMEALKGAAWGGAMGTAGPAVAAGAGKVARALAERLRPGEQAPTIEALRAAAGKAYQAADDAGVVVGQKAVADTADDIASLVKNTGYHPKLHPRIGVALEELEAAKTAPQSLTALEQLRRIVKTAGKSLDPDERRIAGEIVDTLDDRLASLKPADVVAGDADKGVAALKEGRELWSRMRKSEMIEEALEKAANRTSSTGSGGNADNAVRQNIRQILDSPKKARLFNEEERAAMQAVVDGTGWHNFTRLVGKLSPQGNGLMAALGIGATAANPMMAAIPAVGFGSKKIAEALTRGNAGALDSLVRAGGPLQPSALAAPMEEGTSALIRALMTPTMGSVLQQPAPR